MSNSATPPGSLLSKHRLEALCDGVFAVVMTLLVLEIKPEFETHADNEAVVRVLRSLVVPLGTYAFAFAVTAIFWNLHHRKFVLLRHTSPLHTALTLAFLFTVTLLPLSVSIFIRSHGSNVALTVYFGNFTLITIPLLLSWLVAKRAGLVDPSAPPEAGRNLTQRMLTSLAVGAFAMLAGYFQYPSLILLTLPFVLYFRYKRRRPA